MRPGHAAPRCLPGLRRATAALGLVALGACSSKQPPPPPPPCPTVLILEGAERTAAYQPGAEARPAALRYLAVLTRLASACRYDEDGEGMEIDLRFNLIAERGPAFASTPEEVTYFVATLGPGREIVAKDRLQSELVFEPGQDVAGWTEDLTLRVPSATPDSGPTYALFVGFQLDDAQLARRREAPLR